MRKKLNELKAELSFALYKAGTSMFPHPHWEEDIKRLEKEIKELENHKFDTSTYVKIPKLKKRNKK